MKTASSNLKFLTVELKDDDLKKWIRMEFKGSKVLTDLEKIDNRLVQGRAQLRVLEKTILLAKA